MYFMMEMQFTFKFRKKYMSDMVVHGCNPSSWGAETGGLRILSLPGYRVRSCLKKPRGKRREAGE
jgi:hypothetical protein